MNKLYKPTSIRHVGTSGLFKWIKYSMMLVCKLLAAKWITVWPDASLYATLAPNETKHWTASNAPDVDDNSNGVDLRLKLKRKLFSLFFIIVNLSSVICSSNSGCLL